jgi:hypothetical protein
MKEETILNLLKQGCEIKFPSGYILKGDPARNYIDTGFDIGNGYHSDGLRILNEEGVRLALSDAKEFSYENQN